MRDPSREGLTRSEVITVVVVIGVLAMMVVVGLSAGREKMRRSSCQNNLRRMGIALQAYHQAHGLLPPAAIRADAQTAIVLKNRTSSGENYQLRKTYANWIILLLPHLDENQLAASFDWSVRVTDPTNAAGREALLPWMKCPADRYNGEENPYRAVPTEGPESSFSRGNYGINGGVSDLVPAPGTPWRPAPNGMVQKYTGTAENLVERIWGNGVAGFNKSFSVQEFSNGLSNLVGIDELRAGLTPDDCRGVWALGAVGASITSGHGLIGDSSGPNCRRSRSDDSIGCNQVREAFGEDALVREGMPCCSYARSEQATARSMHPGGVNALVMDGSTRFISDDVDLSVWHAIHSRETRDVPVPSEYPAPALATSANGVPPRPPEAAHPAPAGIESITNSVGMRLVRIPAGEFVMGLPDEGEDRGDPQTGVPPDVPPHRVRITKDFFLSPFEITQKQYELVMGSNPSWHSINGGGRTQAIGEDTSSYPVEQVSWVDAVAFCGRLSALPAEMDAGRRYRLPTEAEWEYACRAGSTVPFAEPHGEAADRSGFNVRSDSPTGLKITKVGSYPPNSFGLYDMRGNVQEWCADWHAWDYYRHSPKDDPPGPATGVLRVVRGAGWRFSGMGCHYTRYDTEPWRTNPFIGFRAVCEPPSR